VSIAGILSENEEKMAKAVEVTKSDFAGVRTGRASPALVERLRVDYYGTETPLQQIANISVPENRVLLINVYDKTAVGAVERTIRESDLGLNPSVDGNVIRLSFPLLTKERRRQLVKLVKAKSEDSKIVIRNLRRAGREKLERLEKDSEISQDDLRRAEKELQSVTDKYTGAVDVLLQHKEKELIED